MERWENVYTRHINLKDLAVFRGEEEKDRTG